MVINTTLQTSFFWKLHLTWPQLVIARTFYQAQGSSWIPQQTSWHELKDILGGTSLFPSYPKDDLCPALPAGDSRAFLLGAKRRSVVPSLVHFYPQITSSVSPWGVVGLWYVGPSCTWPGAQGTWACSRHASGPQVIVTPTLAFCLPTSPLHTSSLALNHIFKMYSS